MAKRELVMSVDFGDIVLRVFTNRQYLMHPEV